MADQAAVIAFLEEGGLGEKVERVDTHGAVILLGRALAWKLKREVRFSFMDFSTLARREAAIRAELALNRRTAPELYRRVLPVTCAPDGSLAIDGEGQPVEWLLEMARFPAACELDQIATRGMLAPELVDQLAEAVATFHDKAEVDRERGGVEAMREVIDGNATDLVDARLPTEYSHILTRLSRADLERLAGLIEARWEAGQVRHCHGDLHLANIVLLDGRPVLFDCLEFSRDLATIDTIYDLAFLLMDLVHCDLAPAATRLLDGYAGLREADAALALLPLFIATRAAIRAKVTAFNAANADGEADRLRAEAQRYLSLAIAALRPAPPQLIAIGGLSGTGKSTLARHLAPGLGAMPGATTLRTDVLRKRMLGHPLDERLPADAYGRATSAAVYDRLRQRAATLLRAGRTVIADAVFGEPQERNAMEQLAHDLGIPFHGFWLTGPRDVLAQRIAARRHDASDADVAVLDGQLASIDEAAVTWRKVEAIVPPDQLARDLAATVRPGFSC
jgi:aminoglycoside phosphotransferase family enzyme/predicted kinase